MLCLIHHQVADIPHPMTQKENIENGTSKNETHLKITLKLFSSIFQITMMLVHSGSKNRL